MYKFYKVANAVSSIGRDLGVQTGNRPWKVVHEMTEKP
jgi:hypothetical protein